MTNRQRHTLLWAFVLIVAAWGLAWTGYRLAIGSRMTTEKLQAYLNSTDFSQLSAADRAAALGALADKLNALSLAERRRIRAEREWEKWVTQMTEAEKEAFLEATFPTGIKQMMSAFEELPEDQRRRTMDQALKHLRDSGEVSIGEDRGLAGGRNSGPPISPQLEAKVRQLGLKTFFTESSAQLKVEAAPLLEEIQHQMRTSGLGRRGGR